MLERMMIAYNIVEGMDEIVDNNLNDKVNDAYGLFYAISQLISPLIGAALRSENGAGWACEMSAIFNFSVFVILFLFNGDFRVVSEHNSFNKKLEELRKKNPDYGKEEEDENVATARGKSFGGSTYKRN